jgi:pimeloyl-ACP methyl ester carboxylesterase
MSLATWMTALGEPEESEEFVCVGGARMRCLITGDGPALLLLHGLLGTADAWDRPRNGWQQAQKCSHRMPSGSGDLIVFQNSTSV